MVVKNLPWTAEWLARAGYAGHLVRDLSNTHVMIVGGGTLISTGLCWYVLPRVVGRPLASQGLAQGAFWFTAVGLLVFYIALGRERHRNRPPRRATAGTTRRPSCTWATGYRVPVGIGAGVMGIGYWCFAGNVFLTIFQARLVRVPKPSGYLWKFFATGAAGAHGRDRAGRDPGAAGERRLALPRRARRRVDRSDQPRAHQPRHRADDARRGGAVLRSRRCSAAPRRPEADGEPLLLARCSAARSPSTASALYLGFHEGRLVVGRGLRRSRPRRQRRCIRS